MGKRLPFIDQVVGTCGLCRKPVRRRDSVSVFRREPTERVVEFELHLAPKLMTVHDECRIAARVFKHEWKMGPHPLSEEERQGLVVIERVLGPVEVGGPMVAKKGTKKGKKAKGFKDEYDPNAAPRGESTLPPFADSAQKEELAASGERLPVSAIRLGESRHGPVFHVDARTKSYGWLTLTFSYDGKVPRRDYLLEQAIDWLAANDGQKIPMRLVKSGRTILLELV